jgi:hypothetical protein
MPCDGCEEVPRSLNFDFKLAFIALLLLGFGLFAILQALGFLPADWLRPNPKVPKIIFLLIGGILVLSGGLAFGKLLQAQPWQMNIMGYTVLAASWVVSHWLVFGAEEAKCEIGLNGLSIFGLQICQGMFGAILIAFDIFFLGIAWQWWAKGKHPFSS